MNRTEARVTTVFYPTIKLTQYKQTSSYHSGREGVVPVPDGVEPVHDGLRPGRHALPDQKDQEGVAGGLHGGRVPLLRLLRQQEVALAVVRAAYVAADGLPRPVHPTVWRRTGG